MKFLTLLSLFSLVGAYTVETINNNCFFMTHSVCAQYHAKQVENAINKRPTEYISHSTSSSKFSIDSIIVYK